MLDQMMKMLEGVLTKIIFQGMKTFLILKKRANWRYSVVC